MDQGFFRFSDYKSISGFFLFEIFGEVRYQVFNVNVSFSNIYEFFMVIVSYGDRYQKFWRIIIIS